MPPRDRPGAIKPPAIIESFDEKIVRKMPLQELWNDKGMIKAQPGVRSLDANEVRALMDSAVFVVARLASKLEWIDEGAKKEFWQKAKRLMNRKNATDGDVYFATEWKEASGKTIVVFEEYPAGRVY